MTQELTSIAHAQRKCISPLKEGLEFITQTRILKDRTSPASTRAQNVAVRESAASRKTGLKKPLILIAS